MIEQLKFHINYLAREIGERNYCRYSALNAAADYIDNYFSQLSATFRRQTFIYKKKEYYNLELEIIGTKHPNSILIIGAHYDSARGSPGADDNASGVAALLELASTFSKKPLDYTVRLVAFANEERPFIRTKNMGSYHYASELKRKNESIMGMLSLEMLGYYSSQLNSQKYLYLLPKFYYPRKGNFIALVSNFHSRHLLKKLSASFQKNSTFPMRPYVLPGWLRGVNSSDQWSFWVHQYSALMITDTAFLRNPYYHTQQDTPDKIDFLNLAELTKALGISLQKFINLIE